MVTRISFGSTSDNLSGVPQAQQVQPSQGHRMGAGLALSQFPQPQDVRPAPSTRVHEGVHRITAGDDAPTTVGVARHVMTFSGTAGGSVADTLQTLNGTQTVELVPGQPATRTDVRTAMREGLIQRGAGGRWVDAAAAQAAVQDLKAVDTPEPAPQDGPDAGAFSAHDDALWAEDIAPIPQGAYDAALASMTGIASRGAGDMKRTALALAEAAGMEPELAMDYLEQGHAYYERTVARSVAPLGIGEDRLQDFYSHCQRDQGRLQDAIQKLTHGRDLSGFKAMAGVWLAKNPAPAKV